jgi:hypothetical protein
VPGGAAAQRPAHGGACRRRWENRRCVRASARCGTSHRRTLPVWEIRHHVRVNTSARHRTWRRPPPLSHGGHDILISAGARPCIRSLPDPRTPLRGGLPDDDDDESAYDFPHNNWASIPLPGQQTWMHPHQRTRSSSTSEGHASLGGWTATPCLSLSQGGASDGWPRRHRC